MIRVGLLGPVVVEVDGGGVEFSGILEQALLARLALTAGEGVSRERLIDDLWGEALPRNGVGSLQTLVYRLRKTLGPASSVIVTTGTGYVLRVEADEDVVDVEHFRRLVAKGRQSLESGGIGAGRELLRQALGFWHGPALSGLDAIPFVASHRALLEAARLSALGSRIEADLSAGVDAELVPELQGLVAENPYEEHFWVHLMLAQYRAGSQAGALRSYERLRQVLADELGVEPGPAAKALERSILEHEPSLVIRGKGLSSAEAGGSRAPHPVTVLVTDLDAAPNLREHRHSDMPGVVCRYRELVATAVIEHGGRVVGQSEGTVYATFAPPQNALGAALEIQQSVKREQWKTVEPPLVTVAVHTGDVEEHEGTLLGPAFHLVAGLSRAGYGGQVLVSAATAELSRDGLPEASELLDLGHWTLPDIGQPLHAYALRHTDLMRTPPTLRLGRPGTGTMPVVSTSFVGRDEQLASVSSLVARVPLITLTGLGGVGKTRMALEVGRTMADSFVEGCWFCDLSAATSADEVVERIAATVGLQAGTSEELHHSVHNWLRFSPALLILDNCEQVAAEVAGLSMAAVTSGSSVRLLVTSRCALGVIEEHVVRIDPLRQAASLEEGSGLSPAVRLLVDRSAAAGAALDPEDPALAQVVQRVDGIPLAIELAARRLTAMTPSELAVRLASSFDLLSSAVDVNPRQRTLDSTMDWSFALLAPEARSLYAALSVCSDGWTLEAAEALGQGIGLAVTEIPGVVADLWDRALISMAPSTPGKARYQMLGTVREHASRKLDSDGMSWDVAKCHARFYSELATQLGVRPYGPDEGRQIAVLDDDFDNIRTAFRWCVAEPQWDLATELLDALVAEMVLRQRVEIGRWANDVLEALGDEPHRIRSVALAIVANAALVEGRLDDVEALSSESLKEEDRFQAPPLWLSRNALALAYAATARFDRTDLLLDELIELTAETSDPMPQAVALFDKALLASFSGEPSRGLRSAEKLVQLGERWQSDSIRAMGFVSIGRTVAQEDRERALAVLHEAIRLADASRCSILLHQARRIISEVEASTGARVTALGSLRRLLQEFESSDDFSQQLQTILSALDPLARVEAFDVATVFCAALLQTPLGSSAQCQRVLELASTNLPADVFSSSFTVGSALLPGELLETAIREVSRLLSRV